MKPLQTLLYGGVVCLLLGAGSDARTAGQIHIAAAVRATEPDIERTAGLIVERTNEFRRENQRTALSTNPTLVQTATYFADYLARADAFSHEADGKSAEARAQERGYRYCIVAENIAFETSSAGFTTEALARSLVEGWKRSPGHRRSMLDPDVVETGVAVAHGASGKYYAVQMFGRPESAQIEFRMTNDSSASQTYRLGEHAFEIAPRQTRTHRRCRPAELKMGAPDLADQVVRPQNRDHLIIERSGSGIRLKLN